MARRRTLRRDEEALWAAFVRDIAPIRRAPAPAPVVAVAPVSAPAVVPAAPEPVRPVASKTWLTPTGSGRVPPVRVTRSNAVVAVGQRMPGMDDTSWKALETGKMRAQRTLDLHGHAAQAAFVRLHGFLLACASEGVRCVEIITGLGSGQEGGVIRRELPLWLGRADLRPLVLGVVHPHAANRGSVRILLRKKQR